MDEHKGYIPRDYESCPEGSQFEFSNVKNLPRSEWKQRIDFLNEIEAMPYHWHRKQGPSFVMNQRKSNYCWCYGVCAAIKNCYAVQGIGAIKLNAFAVAYRGKKGKNRGGWGAEAVKYISEWGIPETHAIPEFKKTLRWDRLVQANARQNKIVEFTEVGKNNFDGLVSNLIGDDPAPCSVGYDWWGHLVCALGVAYDRRGNYGIIFVNSWGSKYGSGSLSGGYGIIWGEKKATAYESIAVRNVKAREEVND